MTLTINGRTVTVRGFDEDCGGVLLRHVRVTIKGEPGNQTWGVGDRRTAEDLAAGVGRDLGADRVDVARLADAIELAAFA